MRKIITISILIFMLIITIPSTSLSTTINDIEKDDLKNEEIRDNKPLPKSALVWGSVKRALKNNNTEALKLAVITFIDGEDNYWQKSSGLIGGYYFIILPYGDYTVITRWFFRRERTHITVNTLIQNYNVIL